MLIYKRSTPHKEVFVVYKAYFDSLKSRFMPTSLYLIWLYETVDDKTVCIAKAFSLLLLHVTAFVDGVLLLLLHIPAFVDGVLLLLLHVKALVDGV